ncbi:MAG TPA: acyl-CoA dehydrogenase family protein [Longimicrobium sp.]|nr:acyl-CoA dehydrogenase family protein [Longimicrobium sp.]
MSSLEAAPAPVAWQPAEGGLRTGLGAAQENARRQFAAWTDREVAPFAGEWDRAGATPRSVIERMAAEGFLGAVVPAELGGTGWDAVTFGLLNEELGRGCSSIRSLVTVHSMACHAIARWGSRAQKEAWLPAMARGERIGAFGLSEPEVGSDAGAIGTTAELDGDAYVLRGTKKWTTYGQIADVLLCFAKADGKPLAMLVDLHAPGVTVEPLTVHGTRASMVAQITFDGVRVPKSDRLAGPGFGLGVALSVLELGRYSVACGCVGILRACLDASASYAATRVQGGSVIGLHQLVQAMLADMATDWRAARLLCLHAGWLRDQNDPDAAREVFHAKYFASTAATRAALSAVQIHGANGLTDDYPVERLLRDSRVMEIIEGSTQIQQVTLGRWEVERGASDGVKTAQAQAGGAVGHATSRQVGAGASTQAPGLSG